MHSCTTENAISYRIYDNFNNIWAVEGIWVANETNGQSWIL